MLPLTWKVMNNLKNKMVRESQETFFVSLISQGTFFFNSDYHEIKKML